MSERIILRNPAAGDENLILATWLKGQYFGNPYFKMIPAEIYYRYYTDIVLDLLSDKKTQVLIACSESDPYFIVGFSVTQAKDLYWIYVKKDYRRSGIATLLLKGQDIQTSKSMTRIGAIISKQVGFVFNPF